MRSRRYCRPPHGKCVQGDSEPTPLVSAHEAELRVGAGQQTWSRDGRYR